MVALGVAVLIVAPRPAWRLGRLGVTAVHESGHALAALLVGRRVRGIRLRPDSSGMTVHYGWAGWVRRVVTAAGGYPAPGLLGLLGAWLVAHRELRIWLAALLLLGVVNVVLWIRHLFGLALMAVWIGAIGWLMLRGTPSVAALVGAGAAWYLALGGLRAAVELMGRAAPSDAADIGRLVHLPAGIPKAGFVLVSGAAVVAVGSLLMATW